MAGGRHCAAAGPWPSAPSTPSASGRYGGLVRELGGALVPGLLRRPPEQTQDDDEPHSDERDERRVLGQGLTTPVEPRALAAGVHEVAPTLRVPCGEASRGAEAGNTFACYVPIPGRPAA
jgi:hypothetical protein